MEHYHYVYNDNYFRGMSLEGELSFYSWNSPSISKINCQAHAVCVSREQRLPFCADLNVQLVAQLLTTKRNKQGIVEIF